MSEAIQIEKNVPMPIGGKGRPPKYPVKEMEVGDSFVVPARNRNAVIFAAGLLKPKRFTTKLIDDNCRVWRIA